MIALALTVITACRAQFAPVPVPLPAPLAGARQLVIVSTADWDSTSGVLRRFERTAPSAPWRAVGSPTAIVVGRTGLAWGVGFDSLDTETSRHAPHKREGDGRSPAGAFPLDTAFGFAPRDSATWIRLPYVQLTPESDCVDDVASVHYNTVVARSAVPLVDWTSAERMRAIAQYRWGVIVGYNATPPTTGRGSCIFLHIWAGPRSSTAGCTALDVAELQALIRWLDAAQRPALVQLPRDEYARLRGAWSLPAP
jgi:D-alanyl-D-alanine dipeptidase